MKKNMISVLILALLIINLVLTVIMAFSVIGTSKQTASLVSDIAMILALDTGAAVKSESVAEEVVPIDKIDVYAINEDMTIPLAKGTDGKDHYVLVKVSLSLNKGHKDYKEYGSDIASKEDLIKGEIISVIGSHTIEEAKMDSEGIREEILRKIQALYGSDFIINVTFSKFQTM